MKRYKLIFIALWMTLIFFLSAQNGDLSQNTSDGIVFLVYDFFFKDFFSLTYENYEILSWLIRKLAHFSEYLILAVLFMWFFMDFKEENMALYSVAMTSLYAIFDETHQLFVDGRSFQMGDVLIDTMGAIVGVFIFYIIWRIRCPKQNI